MHTESVKSIINGENQITAVGKTHKRKRYSDEEEKDEENSEDEMVFEDKKGGAYNGDDVQ